MRRALAAAFVSACLVVAIAVGSRADVPVFGITYTLGSGGAVAGPVNLAGQGSVGVDVSGTYSGTLVAECSIGSAVTIVNLYPYSGGNQASVVSTSFTGYAVCPSAGQFKVVYSSYTSGSAIVKIYTTTAAGSSTLPYSATAPLPASISNGGNTMSVSSLGVASVSTPIPLPSCANGVPACVGIIAGTSAPLPVTTAPPPVFPSPYPTNAATQLIAAGYVDSTGGLVGPQICDKTKVSGTISTATTTELLAVSGSNKYYVCGWFIIPTGSNSTNTVTLEYGTKSSTACDTGTTPFTPAYTPATAAATNSYSAIPAIYPFALVSTAAAGDVCALTAGTTTSIQVFLAYATHA